LEAKRVRLSVSAIENTQILGLSINRSNLN